ncbi:MAG: hypothetical protein ACRD7E_12140 [Bryobacteraceae bacterium]
MTLKESGESGNAVTATIDGSFGYEVALYAIEPRKRGGVRVRFVSAEVVRDGASTLRSRSTLPLFVLPRHIRHVRLLFLTRASGADHDMAVIASDRAESLDALTRAVKTQGVKGCGIYSRSHCSWVPAGVAVRPQLQRGAGGPWVPAR